MSVTDPSKYKIDHIISVSEIHLSNPGDFNDIYVQPCHFKYSLNHRRIY